MSQAAALARIFGECREAYLLFAEEEMPPRRGVKYPAPWGEKNKLGHAP